MKKDPYDVVLDEYEQEIEDNLEHAKPLKNMEAEVAMLKAVAAEHVQKRKSITMRVSNGDLIAIRRKSRNLGLPYQTYLNMLIHRDAMVA